MPAHVHTHTHTHCKATKQNKAKQSNTRQQKTNPLQTTLPSPLPPSLPPSLSLSLSLSLSPNTVRTHHTPHPHDSIPVGTATRHCIATTHAAVARKSRLAMVLSLARGRAWHAVRGACIRL
ncbi:uncharacterized protein K452DRAFT_10709 [Aplosporella prunicola CBS 121167]|uniref:Uncharacterized protein n=1 Tax=Aplosporella prunicola CBS 121167 TaxID=1176127 RepID=A0A6A6BIX0_9PEZI|nr:uncharacterized protein K452DRAFT_10709 [Aplosporella prunicola CBS 121167]KAF2142777.1 hypothetical protein K452DRAFT_10709 [Aplosporella prunicola CBS 121167]